MQLNKSAKIALSFVWIASLTGCVTNIDIIQDEARESRVEVQVITETSAEILASQEALLENTASPLPPTFTPSPIPPTSTPVPTSTPTIPPTPTPLPGVVVIPVESLGDGYPWLPMDESKRPGINMIVFNLSRPPFNNALVRQAFAYAVDRQALVEMASRYRTPNARPATSLTPPEILGRDLYDVVGNGFDPQKAKELLAEAGYADPSTMPPVTILVNAYGDVAPGARFNMANAMVDMWKTHLGVTVKVEVVAKFNDYGNRLRNDPPEMFWRGWVADVNDPDNFLREMFRTDAEVNFGHFSNADFDQLVDEAKRGNDPLTRQDLYIRAERLLCETEAALIPLYFYVP